MRKNLLFLFLFILILSNKGNTQVSITGPTCVVAGVQYQYTISGPWNSSTSMSWCITGGIIVNNSGGTCKSGTPLPSIQVIFNSGISSGSVSLTSSIGNSTKTTTIAAALNGGSITANQTQTIASNTIPATISCSAASGGNCTPTYSYLWELSTDNVNWTSTGITTQNLSYGNSITVSTYFRRKVTETASGSIAYSPTASVYIATPLSIGAITGGTSPIVANSSPGQLTRPNATGGTCNGSYTYQWQESSDNLSWQNVSGTATYSPGNLPGTRYYRILVTCNGATAYSPIRTIQVNLPVNPGTITSGNQLIGNNTIPTPVEVSPATDGACSSYAYLWQSSNDANTWTSTGITTEDLSFSTALTQSKYYRRQVVCGGEIKYTAPVFIEVAAILTSGTLSTAATSILFNSVPLMITGSIPSGGPCNGIYQYLWESSVDGTNFQEIPYSNSLNLQPSLPIIENTYFRRKVLCGNVTATSNSVLISIGFNPGILSSPQGLQSGGTATAISLSGTGGGSCGGVYSYSWEKSFDQYNWSVIAGAASSSYSPGVITKTTYYRARVTCGSLKAYSNSVKLKVIDGSALNIPVSSTPSADQAIVAIPAYPAALDPLNLNYVKTRIISKPGIQTITTADALGDKAEIQQVTEYMDGLGRPFQKVFRQSTPLGKDLLSATYYDPASRVQAKHLPYSDGLTTGTVRTNVSTQQPAFYNTLHNNIESHYYEYTLFDNSPTNQAIKVLAPGKSWAGSSRGIFVESRTNYAEEDVKQWSIGYTTGTLPLVGTAYPVGELNVKITTDENEGYVIEYSNKLGQTVLKKVQNLDAYSLHHTGWLCTYYVYDDLNRLRFVIPPRAVELLQTSSWVLSSAVSNDLCFRYEYDERGRMIIKKIPGKAVEYMVYDKRDRLVMSQDQFLRTAGQWMVNKYDDLNRQEKTGIILSASTRATHQTNSNANLAYPTLSNADVYSQVYYDDYTWTSGISGISSTLNSADINSTNFITTYNASPLFATAIVNTNITRGSATGSKERIMGTSNYAYVLNLYDERSLLIQQQSTNHQGGTDIVTNQYDFSKKVIRSFARHNRSTPSAETHSISTMLDYDHAGRIIRIRKKFDGGTEKTIVQNTYDELGNLSLKEVGKKTDGTYLESLLHKYTLRGWLQSINKDFVSSTATNWFGMEMSYDYGYTQKQFNGNIAGIKWKSKGDGQQRSFGYVYDNSNRLTKADFTQYTTSAWNTSAGLDFSVSNLSYDANGNILSMNHKGWKLSGSATIDQLSYVYKTNSNQLAKVSDAVTDPNTKLGDFKDGANGTTDDYAYDLNGNLTSDQNKAISSITYNYLNLPALITVNGKGTIAYTYLSNGTKLKKVVTDNTVSPAKVTTTDYLSGYVYENDKIQFAAHEEGRIRASYTGTAVSGYFYDYFIKDHLGNVRMVLTEEQQIMWPKPMAMAIKLDPEKF